MKSRKIIAKEINLLDMEMRELEVKRSRSMAALVESLVAKVKPDEQEMQFFRQYTAEIEVKRERLSALTSQLQALL